MTVWPEHTSLSRRENTMRSSCKADRYFCRSAVEAASNRPGWSELAGEKNVVFLNTMRSYVTATHLPWFGTGVLVSPQRVCFNERDAWRVVAETGTGVTDCCCLNSRCWALVLRRLLGCHWAALRMRVSDHHDTSAPRHWIQFLGSHYSWFCQRNATDFLRTNVTNSRFTNETADKAI